MTSACVMIAVAHANGTSCPVAGQYLKSFSVDAYGGRGYAEWTADPRQAMRFAGINEALLFRKTQSRAKPFRPDGKPNRPLTAITTLIVAVDLEEGDPL